MTMGVLRDTILVSVATLGVGSAFMEIDSDNKTFNKVFPYVGTFLSAGIGYYLLRKYKFIKAAEYQPDQELSDYSLSDLATSSAIEGFEPFKYSVVGNRAEGLETNKYVMQLNDEQQMEIKKRLHNALSELGMKGDELEEFVQEGMDSRLGDLTDTIEIDDLMIPEYDDPMESWMEEYDAEGILETKPSINLSWNKIETSKQLARIEGEIRTSMIDNKILFRNYYPISFVELEKQPDEYIPKYVSDKMKNNELIERKQMLQGNIFFANDYLDVVGTYEIYEHQFYLVKAEIYVLKEKVKRGQSKYKKEDSYLVFVKPPNKPLEVLAGTAFGVFADEFDDSPIDLYPLIPTSRKEATKITQNFIYNVLMKPKLEFDFDETFEISAGEKSLSDYQNQIIALTYKRKVNYIDSNIVGKVSKSVKITNYYYTDDKAETHLLFGIHESPKGYVFIGPSGNEWIHGKYTPNYSKKWWYNVDKSTGQKTYMDSLRKGMFSKGLERVFRSRPILALWLKSILLDSKNLSKRRINLFNNDKSAWLKQQYAPLLFEDYFPVLMQSGNNVFRHSNTQLIELLLVKMLCIELYKPKIDKITEKEESFERSNGATITKRTFREVISQEVNMKLWNEMKSKSTVGANEGVIIGMVLENFKRQISNFGKITYWNRSKKPTGDYTTRTQKASSYYYQKLYQFAKFIEVVEPDYITSVPSSDNPDLYYPQFKVGVGFSQSSLISQINNWIKKAPIRLSKKSKGDLSSELTIMAEPLSIYLKGEELYDIAKKFIKTPIDDLEAIGIPNKLDDKGFVERDVLQSTFDMKSASHSSMKLFSNPQFVYPKNQKFGNGMFRPNSLKNYTSVGSEGIRQRAYTEKPYSAYPFTLQGMYASVVVFPAIDSEFVEFYDIEMTDLQTESLDYANYHKALPIFLHEPDYLALLSDQPKEKISPLIRNGQKNILYVTPMEINDTKNKAVKTLRTIMNRQSRNLNYEELFERIVQYSNINQSFQEIKEQTEKSRDYYQYLNEMFLEPTDKYGFKHHSARPAPFSDRYDDYYDEEKEAESNTKPYSVEISRSSNPEKKLMAIFSDKEGKKIKTTHFGQRGASDYTKHGDKERMQRYLERHGGGTTTSTKEDWKDPTTAGSLSRWVLWNKPSLSGSFADFKRRFGLKGSLNVSKSSEGLETKNAESYSPGNYDFKPNFGEKNERFDEILESAQSLSRPKLKRVLGLANDNPLTRRPMIKAASIAYFMKEAKDQFPKEMYIEYYMRNFTKQELCRLNLIKGKEGWNLTELRKLTKRELSDMLIIEEMGIAFKSETFEAKSPAQESLDDWNDEKWKTKSGKPSGETGERFLPTKAIEALTDKEYKETSDKKRKDSKKGKQFSDQPKKIAEKTAKYRDAEENRTIDIEDFNKVADAIQASNQPATVLLAPSSYHKGQNYIYIVVGMDAPHSVTNAMFSIMKDLGYHPRYFSIVGNTTTLSRNEYSQIRRLNGGHKNYSAETFEDMSVYGKYGINDSFPNKAKTPMIMIDSEHDHDGDYRVDDVIYGDFAGLLGQYVIWFKHKVANGWKGLEGFDIKLIPLTENSYSIVILMKGKSIYQNKMWKIATDYDYPKEILPYRTSWNNASSGYDFDADAYYVTLNRIYVSPDSLQAKLYKPIWDIYNNSMNAETFEAITQDGKEYPEWESKGVVTEKVKMLEWGMKNLGFTMESDDWMGEKYGVQFNPPFYVKAPNGKEVKCQFKYGFDTGEFFVLGDYYRNIEYDAEENPIGIPTFETMQKKLATYGFHHLNFNNWNEYNSILYIEDFKPSLVTIYGAETFEAIEGKGSNARFTDQPDPKVYRDVSLRQKARNKLLKGTKGGNAGQWSAIKANLSATEYRKLYENKYGEGKNPYF